MTDGAIKSASDIFVTTNIAAAAAATVVMTITWIRFKKPDVSMTLNGALAGLVAVTAGCDVVSPVGAFFIGLIAAFCVVFGIEFIEKILKIDDPVGAIGVHGVCGAVGTLSVGLFALDGGLFYGGGAGLLITQLIGVAAVGAWVAVTMTILFFIIKKVNGLRVSKEEELAGLDIMEHGITSSYADFMPAAIVSEEPVRVMPSAQVTIPVSYEAPGPDVKISKVVVITNQNKFEKLKDALTQIGITGMTVTQVLGFGMQRGGTEYYRGIQLETRLLPKVKVEIVVCKVPVAQLVDTIKAALYTGKIGDGKIFVYDVENVIKVSTGEQGYDALQDETEIAAAT
jgi:Amt family ammonium transporter